jgi:hypothetical protein
MEYLGWNQEESVPLPPRAASKYMLVPVREFDRLQKRIAEELGPRHENLSAAYFALFGAAVATGAAVPPLMATSSLPSWITPTFVVSAAAFLLMGVVLVFVARALRIRQTKAAADISREMRDLRETYHGGSSLTGEADLAHRR